MTNSKSKTNFLRSINHVFPWLLFGFYFFVLPNYEPIITPIIQTWINSLGFLAPLGYIIVGVLATVIAPIGLGPVNVLLQRAFGFWSSVFYFWTFEIIGMSINFWLSRRFGQIFLHLFFAGIIAKDSSGNFDPITKFSRYMLGKNSWSAFAIMLGMGGELLAYLAGLSGIQFVKFLAIISVTQFINSLVFVGSNLTIGTNNNVYFGLQVLSFGLTFIPTFVVFHREILEFCKNFWQFWKYEKKQNKELKTKLGKLKNQQVSEQEFNIWYLNYLGEYLNWNFLFINYLNSFSNFDKFLEKTLQSEIKQKIRKLKQKLGYLPKDLELQILEKKWELGSEKYQFSFRK